jgi:hypothetical protein
MKKVTVKEVNELLGALEEGTTLITYGRLIKGKDDATPKLQLEFAEVIPGNNGINLLALFNEGDERFNSEVKVTRSWFPTEIASAKKLLGIDIEQIEPVTIKKTNGEEYQGYPIGMINPVAYGRRMRIQINEGCGLESNWEKENPERAIKQNGKGGFLFKEGLPIIRRTSVAPNVATHTFKEHDATIENLEEQLYPSVDEDVEEATFEEIVQ